MRKLGDKIKVTSKLVRVYGQVEWNGHKLYRYHYKSIPILEVEGIVVGVRNIWEGQTECNSFCFERSVKVYKVALNLRDIINVKIEN
jgi:hypothetical protein